MRQEKQRVISKTTLMKFGDDDDDDFGRLFVSVFFSFSFFFLF